jgi:ABC-type transport system involved in multi-copper enzyme maturation permease subunit
VKRILAIAGLTWKSAFRYRLFWILAALLAGAVVGLPLLLKDDGTAKGLTQILLTYTLGAVAALLGVATLWLSCGTMAKDVEECQMQMVTVKPIGRWQIWLGKWLGILGLNAMLLALSGTAIFILLQWRASHLPADEQKILRNEIFVARASIKEQVPNYAAQSEQLLRREIDKFTRSSGNPPNPAEVGEMRNQIIERLKALNTEVPPGVRRFWRIDLHTLPERTQNEPLEMRIKFHAANPNPSATYDTYWRVGPVDSTKAVVLHEVLPPDSFQEVQVPAHLLDDKGRLDIDFANVNDTALMFPIEDGFELLYYENSFGVNFVRGEMILLCWLALLAAIGLAAASQLSFPVAAFASMAILLMGLSSGTLQTVVEQGTVAGYDAAKGGYGHSPLDLVFVPIFRGTLEIIQLVESFSPIDSLSTGRSITWSMLGLAVAQIVLLLGGIFCVIGIILFSRRELATAQGNT